MTARGARAGRAGAGAVDVVVIGAGHAGLAMSRCLSERSIEHVVLERGEVANSWRRERWESLRLLTPNRQARLPGYAYAGEEPDGYNLGSSRVGTVRNRPDRVRSMLGVRSRPDRLTLRCRRHRRGAPAGKPRDA